MESHCSCCHGLLTHRNRQPNVYHSYWRLRQNKSIKWLHLFFMLICQVTIFIKYWFDTFLRPPLAFGILQKAFFCCLTQHWSVSTLVVQRGWLPLLHCLRHALRRSPWASSPPGWTVLPLSACHWIRGASDPQSSLSSCAGLTPVSPALPGTGEPRIGASTPDVSHQWRVERHDLLPQPAGSATRGAVGLLCHEGALLAHSQITVLQGPRFLECRAVFQLISP